MAAYEITHTYEEDEIYDVQHAQINDVIYLAHGNHPPKKLTRIAANNWTFTDFPFIGGPFFHDNMITSGSTTVVLSSATITPNGTAGSVTLSASANIFIPSGSTTRGHKNTYWKIGATVTNATTGLAVQGYVQITAVTNPSTATATIKQTLSTGTSATTNWAQGAWSDVLGWPARVTFFQQRLAFARTTYQPQNVWLSKSFIFEDFALDGGADDDAIDIQLASEESNQIQWLYPAKNLIAGTYGGEYSIGTGDGAPLTPATTNVSKETSWGSEPVVPKKIGNFIYYVQRFRQKLRELFYSFDFDTYKSVDRTVLSPHIAGDGFRDLTYQQNPDTVLWCVTTNGTIATMTREVDQEVQGWARQTTDGAYESICAIPSRDEPHDEVWVIVKRVIEGVDRRFIERFKSPIVPDEKARCFYVHSGLTYDAFSTTLTPTGASISLSATAGTTVTVTSSVAYFAIDDIGQRIRAVSSGTTIGELKIMAFTSSTVVNGEVVYTFNSTTYSTGSWGLSVSSISGLDHLEGKDVTVLADGGLDKPNKTVSNGSITLTHDAFIVTAGLPYTQYIKTLPQDVGAQRGTAVGKIQRISEVAFKVNRSHTGFSTGGSDAELQKVQFRSADTLMGTPEPLFTGIIPNITFRNDYKYGSQIIIQNSDPLPIELQSIVSTIDTQEKT